MADHLRSPRFLYDIVFYDSEWNEVEAMGHVGITFHEAVVVVETWNDARRYWAEHGTASPDNLIRKCVFLSLEERMVP